MNMDETDVLYEDEDIEFSSNFEDGIPKALTEEQANGNLKLYLNDLLTKRIAFSESDEEVCDIRDAVYEMLDRILTELSRDEERLVVSKILMVGSFNDGTRICHPDEFDFIILLDEERFGDGRKLEIRPSATKQWEYADQDEYMSGIRRIFCFGVRDVVERLGSKDMTTIQKSTGTLCYIPNQYSRCTIHGPAYTMLLSWVSSQDMPHNSLEISIDIVPAIRMANVERYISRADVRYERLYEDLLNTGTCLVIRKHLQLQMTFTETEATIIKTNFTQKHRDVLKLLKYLHVNPVSIINYTMKSYVLKQYMIHHHFRCSRDVSESIAHCVVDVLQHIRDSDYDETNKAFLIPHLFKEREYPLGYMRIALRNTRYWLPRCAAEKIMHLLAVANNDMTYSYEDYQWLHPNIRALPV